MDGDKLLLLEHADDSAVTVLAQEGDYEGLQIQGPDGGWLGVPVIPCQSAAPALECCGLADRLGLPAYCSDRADAWNPPRDGR